MTFAWYGQLGAVSRPVWLAVLIAWGIAFFEYCLVIPANRICYGVYSAAELKTLQEVVTLIIFAGFAVFWRSEEHTSELQSLMRISYDVFCLHKKKTHIK